MERRAVVVDPTAVKVMMQYWHGDVRVCELESGGALLDLHVSHPSSAEWVIEAHSSRAADAAVITGRGATRALAFSAVTTEWDARVADLQLRNFDWPRVGAALRSVNVID